VEAVLLMVLTLGRAELAVRVVLQFTGGNS
jgi:hypothetical protein